jgi:hypothetical protein
VKKKIIALALLVFPLTASAVPITINWSGEITDYHATPGSGFPAPPLASTLISGTISYNTDFLPAPDPGSNSEFLGFTGGDFITSSIQWAGGVFNPNLPGGIGADVLQITNSVVDSYILMDSSSVIDVDGRLAFLQFAIFGVPDLFGSATASADSVPGGVFQTGSNAFLNLSLLGGEGFDGTYTVTNVRTGVVNVPEPEMWVLVLAGLLALVVCRGRRAGSQLHPARWQARL